MNINAGSKIRKDATIVITITVTVAAAWSESHSVMSDSLWPHGLYSPWNSPGPNIRVGNLSLLHRIFPTQGSNPGLLHCRRILYQLLLFNTNAPLIPEVPPLLLKQLTLCCAPRQGQKNIYSYIYVILNKEREGKVGCT